MVIAAEDVELLDPQRRFVGAALAAPTSTADVKPVGFEPIGMVRMNAQRRTAEDNQTEDGAMMLKFCCMVL